MKTLLFTCLAIACTAASISTVSSVVGDHVEGQAVALISARPAAPFIEIQHIKDGKGDALIGIKNHDVQLSFEYETVFYTDNITGDQYSDIQVISLDDVVVTDLTGKQVYDFTDHTDHQQFVEMIQTQLVELAHAN